MRRLELVFGAIVTALAVFVAVEARGARVYSAYLGGAEYSIDDYCARMNATRVKPGFSYDSGSNTEFLSVPQLQEMIKAEIGSAHSH